MKSTKIPLISSFLDLNLPDSNGAETVKKMRHISDDIPIIVMTGMDIDFICNACIKLGANDVVSKSRLDETIFTDTIRKFIP